MMQFSNPMLLWCLAGLAIPVGIHLLSRKEGKVLRLGSLRHVQETSTQQFKGIRLNEIVLLMLRCAMIILITLLVSGLQIPDTGNTRWLVIEKGLETHSRVKMMMDSLAAEGYESHFLCDGFPSLQDSVLASKPSNYSKLTKDLDSRKLSDIIVFAQNKITGFKGPRHSLPRNIRWIGVPVTAYEYPLVATRLTRDTLIVRTGHTDANQTYFTTNQIAAESTQDISPKDTVRILLVSEEQYSYDANILKASLRAIQESFPVVILFLKSNDGAVPYWTFWFSDKTIPTQETGHTVVLRAHVAERLIVRTNNLEFEITSRLNEEVALKENLTLELAHLLLPSQKLWSTAIRNDKRTLPDKLAWSKENTNQEELQAGLNMKPADDYLLWLLLIILLIERTIAYQRNQ